MNLRDAVCIVTGSAVGTADQLAKAWLVSVLEPGRSMSVLGDWLRLVHAQNTGGNRHSAIDGRTTTWPGYAVSQRLRKRIEETFGWMKTIGNFRKTRWKGQERTQLAAYMVGAAYNLLRLARLLEAPT